MKLPRNDDGTLPAFAWPGGYPIYYLFADGEVCCPDCANGQNGSEATILEGAGMFEVNRTGLDPGWTIVASDVHWEGDALQCAHCNAQIESAYGPVEN